MLEAFNEFNILQIKLNLLCKYYSNHFLQFYSFRYFEYFNFLENFKYIIISRCSIVLDFLSNIIITLKSQNLESNKVIIIVIIIIIYLFFLNL